MKSINIIAILFLLPCLVSGQQRKKFGSDDLKILAGKWTGTLVYTDYQDDSTQVTLKASMEVVPAADSFILKIVYTEPNGKTVSSEKGLRADTDGENIYYDGRAFEVQQVQHNGPKMTVRTVNAEDDVTDNNKPAEIHMSFTISKEIFIIYEEVKYENGKKFFMRNRHMFTKQ